MTQDRFEASEKRIRYSYARLAPPWILASSSFVYGLGDEQTVPMTSDYHLDKRNIRGSG